MKTYPQSKEKRHRPIRARHSASHVSSLTLCPEYLKLYPVYPAREEQESAQIFIDIFRGAERDELHLQSSFLGAAKAMNRHYKWIFRGGSYATVTMPRL